MASNHLEEMVAEWYDFKRYIVKRNVQLGKRSKGGHECELDVVAFHHGIKKLVHIETSCDSTSWEKREETFRKKFDAGKKYIFKLFPGINNLPDNYEKIVLLGYVRSTKLTEIGGGRI